MKLTTMDIARGNLLIDSPFFGAIAVRVKPVADEKVETAKTDGRVLIYNPTWFESLTPRQRLGLLVHEDMHISCLHHTRRGSRDIKLWNIACDFAINLEIQKAGFELPPGALYDTAYEGMGAEAIYSVLAAMAPEDQPGGQPGDWGAISDATDDAGNPVPASEMELAEAETKVMIGQAMQQAKATGAMPAGIERLVTGLLKPRVDWKQVLQRFVLQTSRDGHDWRRPNRRMIGHGFYLPRVRGEFLEVAVAVDTSGSIGEAELGAFLGEIEGILQSRPSKAWIVYCDAEINRVDEVTSEELPLEVRPCGGGGTDFRPVFSWFETCEGSPSCLIYLTDMWGTFPDVAPDFPVLWVKTTDKAAPWGEEVRLE